jgi:hypothetical protein
MVTSEQIAPLPYQYIQGLNLSVTGNKTLVLTSGQTRDSTNQFDIVINDPITIDVSKTGVNGLEQDSVILGNQFYSVYVITSSYGFRKPGALVVDFGKTIVFPDAYNLSRFIGVCKVDGATNLVNLYQSGTNFMRNYTYDTSSAALSGGAATTFTTIDLFPYVPNIKNTSINLKANYTPGAAGNEFALRPGGSTSTNGYVQQKGLVTGVEQDSIINMFTLLDPNNASVDYKVTTGDTLNLYVYEFTIPLL